MNYFLMLTLLGCHLLAATAIGEPPPRLPSYLFFVETSARMEAARNLIASTVANRITTGFGGQIRTGETIGIWTYDGTLRTDLFAPEPWHPQGAAAVAGRAGYFLRSQPFHDGESLLGLSEVMRLTRSASTLTLILVDDGTARMEGTALDEHINSAWLAARSQHPDGAVVMTSLALRAGEIIGWSVHAQPAPAAPPAAPVAGIEPLGPMDTDSTSTLQQSSPETMARTHPDGLAPEEEGALDSLIPASPKSERDPASSELVPIPLEPEPPPVTVVAAPPEPVPESKPEEGILPVLPASEPEEPPASTPAREGISLSPSGSKAPVAIPQREVRAEHTPDPERTTEPLEAQSSTQVAQANPVEIRERIPAAAVSTGMVEVAGEPAPLQGSEARNDRSLEKPAGTDLSPPREELSAVVSGQPAQARSRTVLVPLLALALFAGAVFLFLWGRRKAPLPAPSSFISKSMLPPNRMREP